MLLCEPTGVCEDNLDVCGGLLKTNMTFFCIWVRFCPFLFISSQKCENLFWTWNCSKICTDWEFATFTAMLLLLLNASEYCCVFVWLAWCEYLCVCALGGSWGERGQLLMVITRRRPALVGQPLSAPGYCVYVYACLRVCACVRMCMCVCQQESPRALWHLLIKTSQAAGQGRQMPVMAHTHIHTLTHMHEAAEHL